ncbi:hypothetical protein V2K91_25510 [Pseudomonas alliivorans]|nr:hypothetical protein [Pseudomonas alliivorans]
MFNQLLAVVNLGEKLPEAIGWEFVGPYRLSFPEEILEALESDVDSTYIAGALLVYNYSGVSKSEIRVLYSGSFEFRPKVSYGRRDVPVKWKHDIDNSEFVFNEVPPNEKIEIELFNIYQDFSVDQVLVDGKLVTEFMSKRAIAKVYPAPKWLRASLIGAPILCAAILAMSAYTGYAVYKQRLDNEFLYGVPSGYLGCAPYMFDNPPGESTKEALTRKIKKLGPWMQFLLAKNKVSSVSELYDLDRIVLCTPDADQRL